MHKPVIAVAACDKPHDYAQSVLRAGGEVSVIDRATRSPADVIRHADGVLLTGGGDVLPALYHASQHPTFSAAESGRDEYEIELVRLALDADVPLLAVCRGVQVLNVALGGSLVQDIPTEVASNIAHRTVTPPAQAFMVAHAVQVEPETRLFDLLSRILDSRRACGVNSRHHQALLELGDGLVVVATAPDGIIESVEHPAQRFCVGVQWHPENFWRTGEFAALFEGLVRACHR